MDDQSAEKWTSPQLAVNGYEPGDYPPNLIPTGRTTGRDPILQGSALRVDAKTTRRLVVRMRSDTADRAQVFWATSLSKVSGKNSTRFDVLGDNQFHDYVIELAKCPRWRGVIVSLRLDPANKPGVRLAIDSIELK